MNMTCEEYRAVLSFSQKHCHLGVLGQTSSPGADYSETRSSSTPWST